MIEGAEYRDSFESFELICFEIYDIQLKNNFLLNNSRGKKDCLPFT